MKQEKEMDRLHRMQDYAERIFDTEEIGTELESIALYARNLIDACDTPEEALSEMKELTELQSHPEVRAIYQDFLEKLARID